MHQDQQYLLGPDLRKEKCQISTSGSLLPIQTPLVVAKGLFCALLMTLDTGVITSFCIRSLQRLDTLGSCYERLWQWGIFLDQLRRSPLDAEFRQYEWCDVRGGEKDSRHAMSVESRRHNVSWAIRHRTNEWERVSAVGLYTRPVASLIRRQCKLCLVFFPGPVNYVGLGPGLVELRNAWQKLIFLVTPYPLVRIVSAYGLGASDNNCVVWRWQLKVVVVDIRVPVLRPSVLDEALWSLDGTNGTERWKNQVGEFWKQMRSPTVLRFS